MTSSRILQPVLTAAVVAVVSAAVLITLVNGVLAIGGGIELLAGVLLVAAIITAVALSFVFRRWGSPRLVAVLLTLVVLGVYMALLLTGTQRPSIIGFGPVVTIAAVALAAGAASAITLPRGWRVLGAVGVLGLLWLALTPVLVAL